MPRVRSGGARGPWQRPAPPLTAYPRGRSPASSGRRTSSGSADGSWVLYYSALVAGLPPGARCIGAATAPTPTGPVHAVGDAPLVCPPRTGTLPASDQLLDRPARPARLRGHRRVGLHRARRPALPALQDPGPAVVDPDGAADARRARACRPASTASCSCAATRSWRTRHSCTRARTTCCSPRRASTATATTARRVASHASAGRWPTRSTNFLGPVITGLCGPGGADVVAPSQGGRAGCSSTAGSATATPAVPARRSGATATRRCCPTRGHVRRAARLGRLGRPQIAYYLTPR